MTVSWIWQRRHFSSLVVVMLTFLLNILLSVVIIDLHYGIFFYMITSGVYKRCKLQSFYLCRNNKHYSFKYHYKRLQKPQGMYYCCYIYCVSYNRCRILFYVIIFFPFIIINVIYVKIISCFFAFSPPNR